MPFRPSSRHGRTVLWLLALLTALWAASMAKGFWGAHGESRRAEVAREVLQDDHWLVPTLLGEPFITKPPLLYWSSAASMGLLGVHDWASRVPSLLATLLSWLALLSLGRSYHRELHLENLSVESHPQDEGEAGFRAAAALITMPMVLMMGLNTETEPLLLACTAAAVAAWLHLPPAGTRSTGLSALLPGFFLALGFLVKGPLGWLFPLFGIMALETGLPASRRRFSLPRLGHILLLQLVLALPWFLMVLWRLPNAMDIWLGESVARVTDADFQVHREPWWYYLPRLAVFLPPLLFLRMDMMKHPLRRAPLLWLGLGLLFLGLAGSKRTHYLLSLAPAAALLPLAAGDLHQRRLMKGALRSLAIFLPLVVPLATVLLMARGLLPHLPWSMVAALLALLGSLWLWKSGPRDPLKSLALSLLLLLGSGAPGVLGAVDGYRNPQSFYAECAEVASDSSLIVNWRNDRYSASFYMQAAIPFARNEVELRGLSPDPVWLICQEKDLEPLSRPHRVVLRRTVHDPFQTGKSRVWVLVKADADSMRGDG